MNANVLADLVDSQFNFDVVGPVMMKLRKNPDDADLQAKLTETLKKAVAEKAGASAEDIAEIEEAAKARVAQYVAASKAGKGKGCG